MKKNIWAIIIIGVLLVIIIFTGFNIYQVYKETSCKFGEMPPGWQLCGCGYMKYKNGKIGCISGCKTFSTPLKCVKGYIQNRDDLIEAIIEDLVK